MRSIKLLTKYVVLIALVAVVFGPFSVAFADTPLSPTDPNYYGTSFSTVDGQGQTAYSNGTAVNSTTGKPNSQAPTNDTNCSGITGCLAAMVYYIGPGFASWVASWAAYFFDFIVRISLDSGAYALDFLITSWNIVLSLANMFFIFILIYAAFSIMLRAETARTMQTLAWVIAIALLVNFSFFFTRVVIDAGNILGVQFYNAVAYGPNIPSISSGGTSIPDITKPIMSAIAVDQLLGAQSFNIVTQGLGGGTAASWSTLLVFTVVFLFAAVFFWVLAVALLMVGLKFFLRVVGLWLILVASPLAFVAQTVSNTRKFFQQWLRSLLGLAMYPAVFLFMFWVLNQFASQLGGGLQLLGIGSGTKAIDASAIQTAGAQINLITLIANVSIRMMFILTMLYIMLKVSDWIIDQAGGMAVTLVSRGAASIAGGGFRTVAGLGAYAGRKIPGSIANAAANNGRLAAYGNSSRLGSALWRGANALSRGTYDIRNAPGAGVAGTKVARNLMNTTLVDAGKASTKSAASEAERIKKLNDRMVAIARKKKMEEDKASAEREAEKKLEEKPAVGKEGDAGKKAASPATGAAPTGTPAVRPIPTAGTPGRAPLVGSVSDVPSSKLSDADIARRRSIVAAARTTPTPPPAAPAAAMPVASVPDMTAGRPHSTSVLYKQAAAERKEAAHMEIKDRAEGLAASKSLFRQAAQADVKAKVALAAEQERKTAQAAAVVTTLSGEPNMGQSATSASIQTPTPNVIRETHTERIIEHPAATEPPVVHIDNTEALKEVRRMRDHFIKAGTEGTKHLAHLAKEIEDRNAEAAERAARGTERKLERKIHSQTESLEESVNAVNARIDKLKLDTRPPAHSPDDDNRGGPSAGAMPIPKEAPQDEDEIPPHYRIAAE